MSRRAGEIPTCRRRESGAALVEFALIAPLLLMLLVAALEIGVYSWGQLSLQHAVREAGRFALTMQDGPEGQPRHQYLLGLLYSDSFGAYSHLRSRCVSTSINGSRLSPCHADATGDPAGMFGQRGDRVRLSVQGCWPVVTPLIAPLFPTGAMCFEVTTLYRNEP